MLAPHPVLLAHPRVEDWPRVIGPLYYLLAKAAGESLKKLAVEKFTCVNVANKTWWRHICGPATIQLSPGEYAVAVATRRIATRPGIGWGLLELGQLHKPCKAKAALSTTATI